MNKSNLYSLVVAIMAYMIYILSYIYFLILIVMKKKNLLVLPLTMSLLMGCVSTVSVNEDDSPSDTLDHLNCKIDGIDTVLTTSLYGYYDNGYKEVGIQGFTENKNEEVYIQINTSIAGSFDLSDENSGHELSYNKRDENYTSSSLAGGELIINLDTFAEDPGEFFKGFLSSTAVDAIGEQSKSLDCSFSVKRSD